ncbi:TPM domain-containing protein [Enterococcus crotali]|uniref:TPM domain-containing protein n=1 Tax=Enterococcus crotali TaxID=1453587 RepID=UPI0004705077|nr:TPM domain-containing protein [Enterococcus crotali]
MSDIEQIEQYKELDQRITNYYHVLKRRNSLFAVSLLFLLLFSCVLFSLNFITNTDHSAKIAAYDQQLNTLQQERDNFESGKIAETATSFDTTLTENLEGLKNYSLKENNYSIPIEKTNSNLIINKNNIFVSDNATILNNDTKKKIYTLNKQLAASTKGAQLIVVTVNDLPSGETIESYANKIFTQLGIGDKVENNGILYLIALTNRKFRLEVGYGLENILSTRAADAIINDSHIINAFKEENYDDGVIQVVEQVFSLVNNKVASIDFKINQIWEEKRSANFSHRIFFFFLATTILVTLIFIINVFRARKTLNQNYHDYLEQSSASSTQTTLYNYQALIEKMKQTNLYFILLGGSSLAPSTRSLHRAIIRGKLMRNPSAQKKRFGRILIDDTLYSSNGDMLTHNYLASNYNSDNWSNDSSDDGSSGDSFGGGSSGGGGASGGW